MGATWSLFGAPKDLLWEPLRSLCGSSLEPLHRPRRASGIILELYWALFARLLLLILVSFRSSFYDVVFDLLSEPLGVDLELPSKPSDPKKPEFPQGILTCLKKF